MCRWVVHLLLAIIAISSFITYYFTADASYYFYITSLASSLILCLLFCQTLKKDSD